MDRWLVCACGCLCTVCTVVSSRCSSRISARLPWQLELGGLGSGGMLLMISDVNYRSDLLAAQARNRFKYFDNKNICDLIIPK